MLLVQRDFSGNLIACIEWQLVNEQGHLDPSGSYVWVEQLEVNRHCGTKRIITQFIEQIAELVPTAQWGYWLRRKNPQRKSRLYSRGQLLTFARRDADVAVAV